MATSYWVGNDNNVYIKNGSKAVNAGKYIGVNPNGSGYIASTGGKTYYGHGVRIDNPSNVNNPPPPTPTNNYNNGNNYAPAPVYAPKLNIAGINAAARKQAEAAVNPYYSKVLNEFLQQQAVLKQRQQQQYDTNVKNIEDTLANTLQGNEITRGRTGEDAAIATADVNNKADQFQTDSGDQFTKDRLQGAKSVAQAGLTGGLGAQQSEAIQADHNTKEDRQMQDFQENKNAIDLSKVRTFEDLTRSDTTAKTGADKNKSQEKFNLDAYLQDAAYSEQQKRNELESQRLEAIQTNAKAQARINFNNWLATIKNPAQYLAAVQTYGSSF